MDVRETKRWTKNYYSWVALIVTNYIIETNGITFAWTRMASSLVQCFAKARKALSRNHNMAASFWT